MVWLGSLCSYLQASRSPKVVCFVHPYGKDQTTSGFGGENKVSVESGGKIHASFGEYNKMLVELPKPDTIPLKFKRVLKSFKVYRRLSHIGDLLPLILDRIAR